MNLARESARTFLFQLAGFGATAVAGVLTARALGPAGKGIAAMALLYPIFFATALHFTVGSSIIHHMGKGQYAPREYTGSAVILLCLLGGVALFVYCISVIFLGNSFYRGISPLLLAGAGVVIPFFMMLYFFSSILQAEKNIQLYNAANQLPSFISLALIAAAFGFGGLTVPLAVVAGVGGIAAGGLYALVHALRRHRGASFSRELLLRLMRDGASIQIGVIATFIMNQVGMVFLHHYAAAEAVGYFSVAVSIASVLTLFSLSIETGLFPKVAHETMDEAVRTVQSATRQGILLTGVAAAITAVFSKYVVLFYGGSEFLPAVVPLLLLLPGTVAVVVSKTIAALWLRKGWFLQLSWIATANAAVSLACNYFFVRQWGVHGASLALTAAYFFACGLTLFLFKRTVGGSLADLLVPKYGDFLVYRNALQQVIGRGKRGVA